MKFLFQELKNPTKEDFSFTYDGALYVVKAEGSELLPDFVAKLGANRLADKIWRSPLDMVGRQKMVDSLLGEVINEVSRDKKPSLTEMIMEEKKIVDKVEEKEFPELEDLKKK